MFLPLGPGVTPNSSKDNEWRYQSGWSYSGILVAVVLGTTLFIATQSASGDRFSDSGAGDSYTESSVSDPYTETGLGDRYSRSSSNDGYSKGGGKA